MVWDFHARLGRLERADEPIRVGVLGAGRFGTLALIQLHRMTGVRIAVVADLQTDRALAALERAGVDRSQVVVTDEEGAAVDAIGQGRVVATGGGSLISGPGVDVVLEATGSVAETEDGIRNCLD